MDGGAPRAFCAAAMAKSKKQKTTKKYAATKRMISAKDDRIVKPAKRQAVEDRKAKEQAEKSQQRHVTQVSSSLFFAHNESLGPPYHVLIDTNFIHTTLSPHRNHVFYGLCWVCKHVGARIVSSSSMGFHAEARGIKKPSP